MQFYLRLGKTGAEKQEMFMTAKEIRAAERNTLFKWFHVDCFLRHAKSCLF
jgi:hypothetical protein